MGQFSGLCFNKWKQIIQMPEMGLGGFGGFGDNQGYGGNLGGLK
jgi:hypothetical protein